MNSKRGYKLKISNLKELSAFLDDFRADATKVLAKKWSQDVAIRAVEALDFACLGLAAPEKDYCLAACNLLNEKLLQSDLPHHSYNCILDIYPVGSAILAVFVHGDRDYQGAWQRKRIVEHWGWDGDVKRPSTISEEQWKLRERIWTGVRKRSMFGNALRFQLVSSSLPRVGHKQISTFIPSMETRVESAIAAMLAQEGKRVADVSDYELAKLKEHVNVRLPPAVTKELLLGTRPENSDTTVSLPRVKHPAFSKPLGGVRENTGLSASIDHADIILAKDGRTFIAVPAVGLKPDSRIFVHVGSKDVVFIQEGLNFGTVTDVPSNARDHLKSCKEAILVEVDKNNDGHLLRAKYVAIVTDISFAENNRQAIMSFKKPMRSTVASKELEEWEKKTRGQ